MRFKRAYGRSGRSRQRGAVYLYSLTILFAALVVLGLSFSSTTLQSAVARSEAERADYVDKVVGDVQRWYERSASTVEATADPFSPARLLDEAVPDRRYNVKVGISDRLGLPCAPSTPFNACAPYRIMVVWLPPQEHPDTSTFDIATGAFTADPAAAWKVYSGQYFQLANVARSVKDLDRVAVALQQYFQARSGLTPIASGRLNHFRASDCTHVVMGEVPCYDSYVDGAGSAIPALTGLRPSDLSTSMGTPIQLSNLADSSTSAPPYSMSLRASTPWGSSLQVNAVQPL